MTVRHTRNQTIKGLGTATRWVTCSRLEIANAAGATATENYAEMIREDTTPGLYKFIPGSSYMVGVQYAQHA